GLAEVPGRKPRLREVPAPLHALECLLQLLGQDTSVMRPVSDSNRSGGPRAPSTERSRIMRCDRPFILTAVVAVAAFSLLAAGCGGGGSSSGVASVASSTPARTTSTQNGLVAFSACMRSNGVSNFPDPQHVRGRTLKLTVAHLASANPRFHAAMRACHHLLP